MGGDAGLTTEQWVERCTIRDNYSASRGGGALGGYNARFINCHFENNEARLEGGGLYVWLQGSFEHRPAIVNCYVAL